MLIRSKADSMDGKVLRARDVRHLLATRNVDPELMKVIEALTEQQYEHVKQITALVGVVNQMAEIVNGLTQVGERMREELLKMKQTSDNDIENKVEQ